MTSAAIGTDRVTRPTCDQLLADWRSLTVDRDGRTILLPPGRHADEVVFNVVLPLDETTPEAVAPARLWAGSLPLCGSGSVTLQQLIEELGGELTVRVAGPAAVLAGSCPRPSLGRALDAVQCAVHEQRPTPDRLRTKARELAHQHLLRWESVEFRVQALARRAAFGPTAPLPVPTLHRELTGLGPRDVEDYRALRTDPGWLVVDAEDPPRWPTPQIRAPDRPPPFVLDPNPGTSAPIVAADPGRGVGAVAFAGPLRPGAGTVWETWLACTVLGGYFASRLWERLRARHSRVYNPRSVLEYTSAGPAVLVTATTTSEDVAATVAAVREELTELCRHRLEESELQDARCYLLGSLLRSASGARRRSALMATWLARGVVPHQLLAAAEKIRDATPDAVLDASRHALAPSAVSLAVCGTRPADLALALALTE